MKCPFENEIMLMREKINELTQNLQDMENSRDGWRKEYINKCNINEKWVEKHHALVKELLGTKKYSSLENLLYELYEKFKKKGKI